MKKIALSTLSLALLGAAGAAHAQSSVTLYGVIDTSLTYVHNASGNQHLWALGNSSGGDLAGTRWGIKGQEDLGNGLAAIFQLENGFDPSNGRNGQGNREFGRQAFVGLTSSQFGTVTLGRQYDPVVDLVQAITADNYFGSAFSTPGDVDNYDNSSRTNNAIKFQSISYAGLQFEAMYAFGGVAGSTGAGQTWSLAAAYNNGPLGLAAGYFHADNSNTLASGLRTGWNSTSDGTFDSNINNFYATAKSIGIARLAAQYTVGPFTMGASYSNAQYKPDGFSAFGSSEKFNVGQGFLNYQATPALLLGLGYTYTKSSGDTSATYHQASLGADYSLSKRTDVYLVGAYQHASGQTRDPVTGGVTNAQASIGSYGYNGTSSQELVALGLRHKF
ncbi:MAG TPA: porin [Trinickia sp.]|uniref:porin n=1 Tax=Trinickia sp. TaxID=2571163 RepID=UPI002D0CDED0|nr:porin [Trinickia sp.]HVW48777.1 porin [Trinickia sp.]